MRKINNQPSQKYVTKVAQSHKNWRQYQRSMYSDPRFERLIKQKQLKFNEEVKDELKDANNKVSQNIIIEKQKEIFTKEIQGKSNEIKIQYTSMAQKQQCVIKECQNNQIQLQKHQKVPKQQQISEKKQPQRLVNCNRMQNVECQKNEQIIGDKQKANGSIIPLKEEVNEVNQINQCSIQNKQQQDNQQYEEKNKNYKRQQDQIAKSLMFKKQNKGISVRAQIQKRITRRNQYSLFFTEQVRSQIDQYYNANKQKEQKDERKQQIQNQKQANQKQQIQKYLVKEESNKNYQGRKGILKKQVNVVEGTYDRQQIQNQQDNNQQASLLGDQLDLFSYVQSKRIMQTYRPNINIPIEQLQLIMKSLRNTSQRLREQRLKQSKTEQQYRQLEEKQVGKFFLDKVYQEYQANNGQLTKTQLQTKLVSDVLFLINHQNKKGRYQ